MNTNESLVPDYIRKEITAKDSSIIFEFFAMFSRMEYALKRTHNRVKADWNDFGKKHNKTFQRDFSDKLETPIKYFYKHPPRKQILNKDGKLDWSEPLKYKSTSPSLCELLIVVRTVRNNLFHGGKYPFQDVEEPGRNRTLLEHSLRILNTMLSLDIKLRKWFEST